MSGGVGCTWCPLRPAAHKCISLPDSLRGLDGMHFAFVPMTLPRAVTLGTVLGYLVSYTGYSTHGSRAS